MQACAAGHLRDTVRVELFQLITQQHACSFVEFLMSAFRLMGLQTAFSCHEGFHIYAMHPFVIPVPKPASLVMTNVCGP